MQKKNINPLKNGPRFIKEHGKLLYDPNSVPGYGNILY